ncbi:MAG: hypothetical protein A2340_01805 [Lentisphaerae bacterium RIFOXYB12_FULL_60_10]|nr:MAG: hypothetical protein A2340_01805 [Lentisphaerae bacterium RIFOXYB12_FULL_60_10]
MQRFVATTLGFLILIVIGWFHPTPSMAVHAMDGPALEIPAGKNTAFSVHGSVGILEGEAREIVNIPEIDHKLSELIWDLSGLTLGGAVLSANIHDTFRVNVGLWTALTEGSGGMEDYDWFMYDQPGTWTHQSRHDVKVVDSLLFDANVSVQLWANDAVAIRGVLGLKYDFWKWEDSVIDYTYSSLGNPWGQPESGYSYEQIDPTAIRDLQFDGDGGRTIDYEQTFIIPYIGLAGEGMLGPVRLNAYLNLSAWGTAEDRDYHILRETRFKETFEGVGYLAFGISGMYALSETAFAMIAWEYQDIPETTGDMEIEGAEGKNVDGAGIANQTSMLSASLGLRF